MIKRPKVGRLEATLNSTEPLFFRSRTRSVTGALLCSALIGGQFIYPAILGHPKWSRRYHHYILQHQTKNGSTIQPTEKLHHLSEQAKADLKLSKNERTSFFFLAPSKVNGIFVSGVLKSYFGALIGLPAFFNAENADEVHLEDVIAPSVATRESALPDENKSSLESKLKETIVQSDKAKLFVIAQALVAARDGYRHYAEAVIFPLGFLSTCLSVSFFNKTRLMKSQTLQVRLVPISIFGTFWFITCVFLLKLFHYYDCLDILEEVSDLGDKYVEGGIEHLEKMMQSHLILKELYPDFYDNFDDIGDCSDFVLSLTESLDRLQKIKHGKEN